MLNCNRNDVHAYPVDDSSGAGIIMDVDLEQLIRESERLRVCEAIFQPSIENWHLRDALEAILGAPRDPAAQGVDEPAPPMQEVNHA